jgi:hypothetical protein
LGFLGSRVSPYTLGLFVAVPFASPISYVAAWGWIYHEALIWGVAWTIAFLAFFAVWTFGKTADRRVWQAVVMGLAAGGAMLSRPTVALTAAVPFAYLMARALWDSVLRRRRKEFRLLWPGLAVFAALVGLLLLVNYQRWDNPFLFAKLGQHAALSKGDPKRGEALKENGEFNANRLVPSLEYYTLPSAGNAIKTWPFVVPDQQLASLKHPPQYDYIEGARVPLTLSMSFLLVFAALGTWRLRKLRAPERWAALAVVAGGTLTALSMLTVFAVALRYSAEFLPIAVFLGLVYLVTIPRRGKTSWKSFGILGALLVCSVFTTQITTLEYKVLRQDFPSDQDRAALRTTLHYPYEAGSIIFVINQKRHPAACYDPTDIYSPEATGATRAECDR